MQSPPGGFPSLPSFPPCWQQFWYFSISKSQPSSLIERNTSSRLAHTVTREVLDEQVKRRLFLESKNDDATGCSLPRQSSERLNITNLFSFLQKGHGYHLDLFVLSFSILLCSFLGLPWFVAATVRAITHVRSLLKESELRAPGEKPQMTGVREQRLTGICIHILIGFSVFLTGILQVSGTP